MHLLSRFGATLAVLAGCAVSTTAMAGAGIVTTTVAPISDQVTYSLASTSLVTYVGYTVNIANAGGNTVNDIRFTGTVVDTDPAQRAEFFSSQGVPCVATNAARTAISCAVGQLKAGEAAPTFTVFFRAPARTTTLPNGVLGSCATTDCLSFSGATFYAEGTGGISSVPDNSIAEWTTGQVALGTANPTRVKSAVPQAGGRFFTGSGVSTGADTFTSSLTVPLITTYTTAELVETPFGLTEGCVNFEVCFQSDVTAPPPLGATQYAPYLTIVLRVDKSLIKTGTRINSVVPLYNGVPVGDCANATTALEDGVPCIARRTFYRNRGVSGWTPDLDGDFEFVFLNKKNGSYRLP